MVFLNPMGQTIRAALAAHSMGIKMQLNACTFGLRWLKAMKEMTDG
jgi:hypothetical protein